VADNSHQISGVAGRYASSLYELAAEANSVDAVAKDLDRFQAMIDSSADLQRLVNSPVFSAEDQSRSIVALMAMLFYVAAVMATNLFGAAFPDWFGSLGASLYTLFQVMTLESWSMGIVRPVMTAFPLAWLFFVPFILLSTYAVLNLFIGVIVSAMQEETEAAASTDRQALHDDTASILAEVRALRAEVAALRQADGPK